MKNKNIGIIILAVICAGLMAAVAFTLIKGKNGTPGKQEASVDSEEETNQSGIVEEDGQKYKRNTDIKTILFMGVDKDEKADLGNNPGENGQSDSLNLLVINKVEKTAQILQISRDSMIGIDIYDVTGNKLMTEDGQIALQYAYGDGKEESCELMKTAVSNLLHGLPIQGYYSMNISGISEVGKLVGDVEIVVPDDSLEEHDPYFKEGATVIINGDNAEEFLRYRDTGKSQSALVRQQRQKTYLKALIPKLQEKMQTNSSFVGSLLDDIQPYTVTNMGNDVFAKLLNAAGNSTLETQTVPGEGVEGKYYDEYHVNEDELYGLILSMFYHKI